MIHNLPTCRLLCIDVPEGAINIGFLTVHNMLEWKKKKSKIYWDCKLLPPGNWELLGRFEDVTEEVWKGIVEPHSIYSTRMWNKPEDMNNVQEIHHKRPVNGSMTTWKRINKTTWTDYKNWEVELPAATASARSLIAGNPVVLIEKSKNSK